LIDPTSPLTLRPFRAFFFHLSVIGLADAFSALALCHEAVIEIFVYPAWPTHGVWATCFLVVIARARFAIVDHLSAR